MVDLVFVVKKAVIVDWHAENLAAHPHHYAPLLRTLGPAAVARFQQLGPGLYYNPHVLLETRGGGTLEAKYGVITAEAMLKDLLNWNWLYLAGRMHKPCVLEPYGCTGELEKALSTAVATNRQAALSAAVLLAGWETNQRGKLSLWSLWKALVRLSYDGDVRVGVAEDPKKVSNIVSAQADELLETYTSYAESLSVELPALHSCSLDADGSVRFNATAAGRQRLFEELPLEFQWQVRNVVGTSIAPWEDAAALRAVLASTVRRSSLAQTAKGLLTAGASRSLRYGLQKLSKRFK